MSTLAVQTCDHVWKDTGVQYLVIGHCWEQTRRMFYCATCRKFSNSAVDFLDGTEERSGRYIENVNYQELDRGASAARAWLAAHYPEHVREVKP